MRCRLEILEIELPLRIGCSAAERELPQPIGLALRVTGPGPFEASRTDRLSDTLDAAEIQSRLASSAREAQVETLERLGRLVEESMAGFHGFEWELRITKAQRGWAYVHAWAT